MDGKFRGLFLTIFLSLAVIFIFFGKILKDPGNYYFAADGDGFKAYYGAIFHSKYDTSHLRMNGMNYPFGESVFFTGCMPVVADATKCCNKILGADFSVTGAMNLLMIFSILVAALFLFLIFYELRLPWWYAAVVSIGICMLSPQIARFGGHFSLAYLFWIPMIIYLVIKFDQRPSVLWTVLIALATFSAGFTHLYFVGFFGFVLGFYWLYRFLNLKKTNIKPTWAGFCFFLQYIFPVALLQVLISATDNVTDRTNFPFGFFEYMGHPLAVLLPSGKPYSFIPENITVFNHIQWEALAFVGVAALAGFLAGSFFLVKKAVPAKAFYKVTDAPVLNVLFWGAFFALLFSFGIPFILGLENLADYIGPIKQLRALARFSWLFFYMLNIVVFYSVYKNIEKRPGSVFPKIILVFAVCFLLFDGTWNISIQSRALQNRRAVYEDKTNISAENEWVKSIDPKEFQAILPLPYFHVGSENIWIESRENTQELAMYVSLKTGLPMTAVQLSRTSISQTYLNTQLVTEPLTEFEVLKNYPDERPLLLLFNKKHYPTEDEVRLIQAGDFVFANGQLELRKLPLDKLRKLPQEYREKMIADFESTQTFARDGFLLTDTTKYFIYSGFDSQPAEKTYKGGGALTCLPVEWNTLAEDTLKNVPAGEKFVVSFWVYNYQKDANLRQNLEVIQTNTADGSTTNYIYTDTHRNIRAFDGGWALIEISFATKTGNEKIKLSLRNRTLKHDSYVVDELMIREEGLDVYSQSEGRLFYNSRIFKAE